MTSKAPARLVRSLRCGRWTIMTPEMPVPDPSPVRPAARRARARVDHPFSRALAWAGARRRGHHASAAADSRHRARQSCAGTAGATRASCLRSNREPAAIGQRWLFAPIMLVRPAALKGCITASEFRNLSVFLRPAGKGARGAALRPPDHGPQTAAGRRDPAPGSPAGGDGRRRRRRMGVGVQPD